MKNRTFFKLISFLLIFTFASFQANADIKRSATITVADGVNGVVTIADYIDLYVISGTETLTSAWAITATGTPAEGMYLLFKYDATVTLGGNSITILGTVIPDVLAAKQYSVTAVYSSSAWNVYVTPDFSQDNIVPYSALVSTGNIMNVDIGVGAAIDYSKLDISGSVVNADIGAAAGISLNKLATVTPGTMLVADGSGFLVSSAVTATEAGYLSGVTSNLQTQLNSTAKDAAINDASIAPAAAIAVNKLAATTTSRAMASDGSGFLTPSATTATELGYLSGTSSNIQTQLGLKQATSLTTGRIWIGVGGTAAEIDVSGNAQMLIGNGTTMAMQPLTGDVTISNAGVTSIANKAVGVDQLSQEAGYVVRDVYASFHTDKVGDKKIFIPYECDLTYVWVSVEQLIEASDVATVHFEDGSSTNMTGSLLVAGDLTLTAGSVTGTVFQTDITGNNSFTAGDYMIIDTKKTTATATAGGTVWITLKFERSQL